VAQKCSTGFGRETAKTDTSAFRDETATVLHGDKVQQLRQVKEELKAYRAVLRNKELID